MNTAVPSWALSRFVLEENTYDEYENDLGITAIALYDYQAGEEPGAWPTGGQGRGLPLCGLPRLASWGLPQRRRPGESFQA